MAHPNARRQADYLQTVVEDWSEFSQGIFEAKCLSAFIKLAGLSRDERKLVDTAIKRHGKFHIGAFYEALPEYPYNVLVAKATRLKEATRLDHFFKPKLIAQFVADMREHVSDSTGEDERPLLMLMRLPYVSDLMCIHDSGISPMIGPHAQLRLPLGDDEGNYVTLEAVDAIMRRYPRSER